MYNSSQTPKETFMEISLLAARNVDKFMWAAHSDNKIKKSQQAKLIIPKIIPDIRNQVIFEIYYVLYLLCEEKHPIYYFIKKYLKKIGKDNSSAIMSEQKEYYTPLYAYKQFRKNQDETAKQVYNIENIGLYKLLDKLEALEGHELRLLDYYFLKRTTLDSSNISYMLNILKDYRLPNANKVKSTDFKDSFVKGIDELYQEILTTDYAEFSIPNKTYFLRSIDFYQFEKNCSIEMCYNAAYSVSKISKKNKQEKDEAIKVFRHLRIFNQNNNIIQNRAITISKNIFNKYLKGYISCNDVHDIYLIANYIIHNSLYSCLETYLGHYFEKETSLGFYLDIYQNPELIKAECELPNIDDFMCKETELFFKNFIGKGQHITNKTWEDVKLRHFRDMYNPIEIENNFQKPL